MCNHLFAVNCCHGSEREEVGVDDLIAELNRQWGAGRETYYIHYPATSDSLGSFMDWFDFCPRCGTALLPEIQQACDMINKNRLRSPQ